MDEELTKEKRGKAEISRFTGVGDKDTLAAVNATPFSPSPSPSLPPLDEPRTMASPELRLLGPEPEINSGLSPSFYAFSEAETQHPPPPPPPPPPSRAITARSTRVISLKYEGSGETSLPLRDLSKIGECTRSHSFVSISIYLGIGIAVRKIATDARSLSDRKKKGKRRKKAKKKKIQAIYA